VKISTHIAFPSYTGQDMPIIQVQPQRLLSSHLSNEKDKQIKIEQGLKVYLQKFRQFDCLVQLQQELYFED